MKVRNKRNTVFELQKEERRLRTYSGQEAGIIGIMNKTDNADSGRRDEVV